MKLTVVTINLNNLAGLRLTMESVLAQLRPDTEYIVIDGASTDGSAEYISSHKDKLAYWVSEKDSGIYNAMNKGIAKARGEYIQFLNSGDTYHDNSVLARVLPRLRGKDFYTGDLLMLEAEPVVAHAPKVVTTRYLAQDTLMHPATFIHTRLLKERSYREDLRIVSDWEQIWHELIIGNATYERLGFIVSDFDMTGLSATCGKESIQKERDQVFPALGNGRLWRELGGGYTRYERKVREALLNDNIWERYFSILSLTVQFMLKSMLKRATGRKDDK